MGSPTSAFEGIAPSNGRSQPIPRTSAPGGGFNWSMQHTRRHCGGRSVAGEETTAHLLLGQTTGTHLGALAEGRDAAPDRPAV